MHSPTYVRFVRIQPFWRQHAHVALRAAARGYVLESSRIAAEASAKELPESELVRKTYPVEQ